MKKELKHFQLQLVNDFKNARIITKNSPRLESSIYEYTEQ